MNSLAARLTRFQRDQLKLPPFPSVISHDGMMIADCILVSRCSSPGTEIRAMTFADESVIYVSGDADAAREWASLLKGRGLSCQHVSAVDRATINPDLPGCCFLILTSDRELDGIQDCIRWLAHGDHRPLVVSTRSAELLQLLRKLDDRRIEVFDSTLPVDNIIGKLRLATFNDTERRRHQIRWREMSRRFESLTEKELEVLQLLLEGLPNKTIGSRLQISERAVEMRRAGMMKKLKVSTHAALIRCVTRYEVYRDYGLPLPPIAVREIVATPRTSIRGVQ